MYSILKPLLFGLEPERAHAWTLKTLHTVPKLCFAKPTSQPVTLFGLTFPHRIGLAAGLDKSGEHLQALSKLGFAFIEIGTATPKPQVGNPKPRLFRLPAAQALINRMGFNNPGIDALVDNVKRSCYSGILGINIGKGKETPLSQAIEDYQFCLERAYAHASYVVVNISSPNTPELRQLQQANYFLQLIVQLREAQLCLADQHKKYVPLLIKISPDESDATLQHMAEVMLKESVDGAIISNTTCDRTEVAGLPHATEMGGLSGSPLLLRSTACLTKFKRWVGNDLPLIGVGGIDGAKAAQLKYDAGAELLQVYTGLIYQGPSLIRRLSQVQPT